MTATIPAFTGHNSLVTICIVHDFAIQRSQHQRTKIAKTSDQLISRPICSVGRVLRKTGAVRSPDLVKICVMIANSEFRDSRVFVDLKW